MKPLKIVMLFNRKSLRLALDEMAKNKSNAPARTYDDDDDDDDPARAC